MWESSSVAGAHWQPPPPAVCATVGPTASCALQAGCTLLHRAAAVRGRRDSLVSLLNRGADIQACCLVRPKKNHRRTAEERRHHPLRTPLTYCVLDAWTSGPHAR